MNAEQQITENWRTVPTFRNERVGGSSAEISFEMLATSVLVPKGHRLRVAISGADKGIFQRIPDTGDPVLTLERNQKHISYIELPVIPRS